MKNIESEIAGIFLFIEEKIWLLFEIQKYNTSSSVESFLVYGQFKTTFYFINILIEDAALSNSLISFKELIYF